MRKRKSTEARRRNRANRRKRAKQKRLEYLNANGPCIKCGSFENLQFDHIHPHGLSGKLKQNPSQDMWMWGENKRQAELKKCQILCKHCHQIKSSLERRKYEHGRNLYDRHGCRCSVCKAAHAEKKRLQRLRKKLRQHASFPETQLPYTGAIRV